MPFGENRSNPKAVHSAITGYLILVLIMVVGFIMQYRLANRLEAEGIARHVQHCETQNNMKQVISDILEIAAQNDTPAEAKRRGEFHEQVDPLLKQRDCGELLNVPPPPLPARDRI